MTGLGRSMLILLRALEVPAERFIPRAGGRILKALEEARGADAGAGNSVGEVRPRLWATRGSGGAVPGRGMTEDRGDPFSGIQVHESWLLEPLAALPLRVLVPLVEIFPPVIMRGVAKLLEEKGGISFGRVMKRAPVPPVVRLLIRTLLPPTPSGESVLLRTMEGDPIAWLSERFPGCGTSIENPAISSALSGVKRVLFESLSASSGPQKESLATSLCHAAFAFLGSPDDAVRLAISLPKRVGGPFLKACRTFHLLIPTDLASFPMVGRESSD